MLCKYMYMHSYTKASQQSKAGRRAFELIAQYPNHIAHTLKPTVGQRDQIVSIDC